MPYIYAARYRTRRPTRLGCAPTFGGSRIRLFEISKQGNAQMPITKIFQSFENARLLYGPDVEVGVVARATGVVFVVAAVVVVVVPVVVP